MIVSIRSSVTTRSAAARAAGVPRWPRAMPTSASRIAGASLAPSPVIATVRPHFCNAWMIRTLWAGVHRATTSVAGQPLGQRVVVELVEFGGGDHPLFVVRR